MKNSHFGQCTLWLLLIAATFYVYRAQLEARPTLQYLSVAAYLPEALWHSTVLFSLLKALSVCAFILWGLNLFTPLSALVAACAFCALIAQSIAGQIYAQHQPHVVCVLLIFYAFWYYTRRHEIAGASPLLQVGRAAPTPRWLYQLSLLYVASTYTYAGISKLMAAGISWAEGGNLQLWCAVLAPYTSLAQNICLYDRTITALAQIVVLFFETTCIAVLAAPRLRAVYGFALLGFHLGVEWIFGFQFYGNILALLMFFILYPQPQR